MTFHSKKFMDHIPHVPPLALHRFSMVDSGAHYKDALRRGLPLHLDAGYLDAVHDQVLPYRRIPCFPLHGSIGVCEYPFEPAFIRKRNERERHRVRCVNEGYARLREHLPQEFDDRRLSKVETLRAAIDYIKHLQSLLDINVSSRMDVMPLGEARSRAPLPHRVYNSDGESKTGLSDSGDIIWPEKDQKCEAWRKYRTTAWLLYATEQVQYTVWKISSSSSPQDGTKSYTLTLNHIRQLLDSCSCFFLNNAYVTCITKCLFFFYKKDAGISMGVWLMILQKKWPYILQGHQKHSLISWNLTLVSANTGLRPHET